jgi:membrane-bound serine protease (ClpP class)
MKKALALLLLLCAMPALAQVYKISIDDAIHPVTEEYIGRGIDAATKAHASAVLIELNTPGGLYTSTRSIVDRITTSPIPVIVFVRPGGWAASAGFFILESADIAAMAPGTNTGASHPVLGSGATMDPVMKEKIENDSAAFMRSFVAKRGRNVDVAESAVRQSKSFTDQEALKDNLIDVIANSDADLLKQLDGREVKRFDGTTLKLHTAGQSILPFDMTVKQRVLAYLLDPNIAFVLFSIGMLAIWAEFSHPGAIVPGVVGGVCILLAGFAMNLLPIRFAALILILAAFIFFALEAKLQSHGVLTIGGIIAMVFGALMLVDGPIPEMRIHLSTALAVAIPLGAITSFLMTIALRARRNKVVTGREGLQGQLGFARSTFGPGVSGKVFVNGELWNAEAQVEIRNGDRVRVAGIDGLILTVEPVSATSAPQHPAHQY